MNRTLLLIAVLVSSARLYAFDVETIVQHATCGNPTGSINCYPSGGVWPFTYLWSNGATDSQITDVPPGTYTVTVTDAEGETGSAEVELIATTALFPPAGPGVDIWSCEADCNGVLYQYWFPLNGVAPYTSTVDPPGPIANAYPGSLTVTGLCVGTTYTVTVTDAEGCTGVYGPLTLVEGQEPIILSSSATPSCPDGSTGSLTVEYDHIDSLYIYGPDNFWYMPLSNPFTLTNLAPGEYYLSGTVFQLDLPSGIYNPNCYYTDTLVVPETTEPCGTLSGIVYADVDDDCAQGGGEPGLPYRVLTVGPGGHLLLTDGDGAYSSQYFYGTYGLDAPIDGYTSDCTTLPVGFTLDSGTPTATIDLAMSPTFGPDLAAYIYVGGHVPGFPAGYHVTITNSGPYTFSDVTLDLYFDPLLTLATADGSPVAVGPGQLQWALATVEPFSTIQLYSTFDVPVGTALGTIVTGTATITMTGPDSDPANDTYSMDRTVTGAFDPNDKLPLTSSRTSGTVYYLDEDNWVDYTIRFQNTGTGPAYNVYLLDTISPLLDLTSFTILASSHTFEASLGDARDLRFDFFNIMLPDSGSDMAGSQGFISFRLRPMQNLAVGQQLVNAADIYFDFNEPIRTNDAVLDVEQSTGIGETQVAAPVVYPNPVTDVLRIDLKGAVVRMDVISADGRTIHSQRASTGTNQFDTRPLTPGAYSIRVLSTSGAFQHARFVKR